MKTWSAQRYEGAFKQISLKESESSEHGEDVDGDCRNEMLTGSSVPRNKHEQTQKTPGLHNFLLVIITVTFLSS